MPGRAPRGTRSAGTALPPAFSGARRGGREDQTLARPRGSGVGPAPAQVRACAAAPLLRDLTPPRGRSLTPWAEPGPVPPALELSPAAGAVCLCPSFWKL